jgi:hypothetical protein
MCKTYKIGTYTVEESTIYGATRVYGDGIYIRSIDKATMIHKLRKVLKALEEAG